MGMEPLRNVDTYPNPLGLPGAVIDLRVYKHEDSDYAIMAMISHLQDNDWAILRYDCDLEQGYAHLQARRYDIEATGAKTLAVKLRELITADQSSRLCWVVIETANFRVQVNWEGVTYDRSGAREQVG